MEIKSIKGDLLTTDSKVIIHQVNCRGAFKSGLAKAIDEKYPEVTEKYKGYCEIYKDRPAMMLGMVLPVKTTDGHIIMNMFSQENYGYNGYRYTSYDALDTCLNKISKYCLEESITEVSLPFKMSSVRGGACWEVVLEIIKNAFSKSDITVKIYDNGK